MVVPGASARETERREWAWERGIEPAQTPDETMLMGKRAPSSFVQLTTPMGNSVSMEWAARVRSMETPAVTPRMPS